jgi:hypothetical protein
MWFWRLVLTKFQTFPRACGTWARTDFGLCLVLQAIFATNFLCPKLSVLNVKIIYHTTVRFDLKFWLETKKREPLSYTI